MTATSVVFRSAAFYWRTHLGVVLGTALAAMVLIGSLLVGDSVKATLRQQAEMRVGRVDVAMTGGDRFFRQQLGDDTGAAPVLVLRGSVATTDGGARINNAQVLGVDARFTQLAPGSATAPTGEQISLNARAAAQLGVKAGDTIVIRLEKPSAFSKDAPLSGEEDDVVAIRADVASIADDAAFGRFGLTASQVPPFNIFVPLEFLQKRLGFEGKANLLLARGASDALKSSVLAKWNLQDAGLELRPLPNQRGIELRSSRVFLDEPAVKAAPHGLDVLTYFVNELRLGEKATPYSMVSAVDAPSSGFLPAELADDEIVITQWLADDLGAKLNDRISMKYLVMGERRQLTVQSREFEIIQIVPMNEPGLDSSWMPDFPGLSDQANCRDWKPGFAIDTQKIRDTDEAYWKQYRGTPKAFVNLRIGQQMWGNRWGNLTAIRYPATVQPEALASEIRARLSLEQLGFQFVPLREQALAATKAPVDFAELFVSFSFFLIAAAAALTGMLFVFTLEQRATEVGTLLALGLPPKLIRRMLLAEGAVLALLGTLVGCACAILYTRLVLIALGTVWRGAVGTTDFVFHATAASLAGGAAGSMVIALFAIWWAGRKQFKRTARALIAGDGVEANEPSSKPWRYGQIAGGASAVGSIALAALGGGSPGAFFGAGALLLIAGLIFGWRWLRGERQQFTSASDLAQRNTARRRGRSLATVAILASGVFMVVAVDSFRQRPQAETTRRDTGTGGFALVAESASPIYEDLNSASGQEAYALDDAAMKDVRVVPLRVRDGDDASCLNLNRALQPRLLGVKPSELDQPLSYFRLMAPSNDGIKRGWAEALTNRAPDGSALWKTVGSADIPGIVDANTLQWALQKKVGDFLEYRDERGTPFKVVIVGTIAGSMLQGNVLIAEQRFIERFPGAGGYRFFLIDAPADRAAAVAEELSRALQDRGLEVTPSARRLADFQAVENTYLSIFQSLGGLGLLLGTAGLAIVVARNVLERRREFGLLEAVGFRAGQLRGLVFAEHRWLIALGLGIGVLSALVAVWPQLSGTAGGFPWRESAVLIAALTLGSMLWTWAATRLALRGSQLDALRAE